MIGIVGQGFVGNAVYQKFKKYYDVLTYDINQELCNSDLDNLVRKSEYIFVCLPTPMNFDGNCDLNIIESSLLELNTLTKFEAVGSKTVIIKSTILL